MTLSPARRHLMLALASLPFAAAAAAKPTTVDAGFAALERDLNGALGVAVIDAATGRTTGYRQNQRFPMCSTFKVVLAAAVLAHEAVKPGLLERRLSLPKALFVDWSPITGKHVDGELSVAQLCAAALQYSDNTAGNALLRELGGPGALTSYARALGDERFRLDRWETELNMAAPGDERDTSTPLAMARTLQKLLLLDGLPPARQVQLRDWMLGNTTGATRIRAAVPAGWQVADKTGTGGYGSANDIAVIYPPGGTPIVLAIYTRQLAKNADARSDIIVRAAKIALNTFGS
ncbi:class A beta-lactamase [Massilia niabensis]|uniref:Beta-lactamase n=1 Tax=Massilia niabensis TaxID=544910 RepID=A0ABW0L546_9BURK